MTSTRAAHPADQSTLEQLLRWKAIGWEPTNDHRATELDEELRGAVITAAQVGTRDEFAHALGELVNQWGPWNGAYFMSKALQSGDQRCVDAAFESNPDLQALHRTAAERAGGRDVAEVATTNGLRLRAEATGDTYQTAVLIEDEPGRCDVLASSSVTAAAAIEALKIAAEREHAVHGLDQSDMRLVTQQIARLEHLISNHRTAAAYQPPEPSTSTAAIAASAETISEAHNHLDIAKAVTGCNLEHDPGVVILETTLQNADNAGWNIAENLPGVLALGPLSETHPAHDLAYRVMDACPDATPPPPTVSQINNPAPSSGRARQTNQQAIARSRSPDHGHTIGR